LIQIPHAFFERETLALGSRCPRRVNTVWAWSSFQSIRMTGFCAKDNREGRHEEGLTVLGWRDTPINGNMIGRLARNSQPYIEQIFIKAAARNGSGRPGAQTIRRA